MSAGGADRPAPAGRDGRVVRVLREPMVHFLLIGAALFMLDGLKAPSEPAPDEGRRIVVTEGRVRQLAQGFAAAWGRPPAPGELRGLVDAFVKEEVFYREALRLGFDRDDTLVRRRMQQKMEFLIEPGADALTADESALQAHLEANRAFFRIPAQAAFRQVFVGDITDGDAQDRGRRLLAQLRTDPAAGDPSAPGARTLLPRRLELTSVEEIERVFGPEFADALAGLPRDQWAGPVRSAYGLHLVRVTEWEGSADPALDHIRSEVERHWRQSQRAAHLRSEYERLLANYEVVPPAGPWTRLQ